MRGGKKVPRAALHAINAATAANAARAMAAMCIQSPVMFVHNACIRAAPTRLRAIADTRLLAYVLLPLFDPNAASRTAHRIQRGADEMARTRQELDALLLQLERDMPGLIEMSRADATRGSDAIAKRAQDIVDDASIVDSEHVRGRVDRIVEAYGLTGLRSAVERRDPPSPATGTPDPEIAEIGDRTRDA